MASSKRVAEAQPPAPSALIYIGPDIPGLAARGQTFLSLPEVLTEHITACPSLGALFVSPERYARARGSDMTATRIERVNAYFAALDTH